MIHRLTTALVACALLAGASLPAAAQPRTQARASSPAPAAPPLSAEDRALVDRAAAYLEGLTQARARFVQTDARGAVSQGELYLKRPGKMRFDYDKPSSMLIVSDGSGVILFDRRLKTFERYPLGSTPLALFLSRRVRLNEGVIVNRVTRLPGGGFSIQVRDGRRQAQGQVTLTFSDGPLTLREWSIIDAQGARTHVRLDNLRPAGGLEPSLFVVRDPRMRPGPR